MVSRHVFDQPGLCVVVAKRFFKKLKFRLDGLLVAGQGHLRLLMRSSLNACTELCHRKTNNKPAEFFGGVLTDPSPNTQQQDNCRPRE